MAPAEPPWISYGINLIDIDQIRTRNFLPPASLEKPPRSSENKCKGWNKRWPEVLCLTPKPALAKRVVK